MEIADAAPEAGLRLAVTSALSAHADAEERPLVRSDLEARFEAGRR